MSLNLFWIFRVEFEVMSQMYISGSLIHHFGHALTYNFLCRIPQINSKGVAECGKETNTRFFFFGAQPDPLPPLPS
jgi:hypothetical protein